MSSQRVQRKFTKKKMYLMLFVYIICVYYIKKMTPISKLRSPWITNLFSNLEILYFVPKPCTLYQNLHYKIIPLQFQINSIQCRAGTVELQDNDHHIIKTNENWILTLFDNLQVEFSFLLGSSQLALKH